MKRSLLHQSFAVEKCIRGRENVVCNVNYLVSEKRLVKSDHQSKTASHFCVANGGADIRPLFVHLPNFGMLVRCCSL